MRKGIIAAIIIVICILGFLLVRKQRPQEAKIEKYAYEIYKTDPLVVCLHTTRPLPMQVVDKERNLRETIGSIEKGDVAAVFAENPLVMRVGNSSGYESVIRFFPSARPEGDLDSWILAQFAQASKKLGWNIEKYQNHSFACPPDSDTKTCKQDKLIIKLKIDYDLFVKRMRGVEGVVLVAGPDLLPYVKEGYAEVSIGKMFTWDQVMPAVDSANSNGFF